MPDFASNLSAPTVKTLAPGRWLSVGPPKSLRRTRITFRTHLPLPAGGLTAWHVADLHIRRVQPKALINLAAECEQSPPDLVLHTGDYVDSKRHAESQWKVARPLLEKMRGRSGTFGVVGNHDRSLKASWLNDAGITTLRQPATVDVRGVPVDLAGLWGRSRKNARFDWPQFHRPRRDDRLTIALTHFPDWSTRVKHPADLTLAGHTHGGQICLPVPIITNDDLPRSHARGVHPVNGSWLVVSRGLGTTRLHARFLAPPELVELRFLPADARS